MRELRPVKNQSIYRTFLLNDNDVIGEIIFGYQMVTKSMSIFPRRHSEDKIEGVEGVQHDNDDDEE